MKCLHTKTKNDDHMRSYTKRDVYKDNKINFQN